MTTLAAAPDTCRVLRDGVVYLVNVEDLAPGERPHVPEPVAEARPPAPAFPTAPETGWDGLTNAQLAHECEARGLTVSKGMRKADLVALLAGAEA